MEIHDAIKKYSSIQAQHIIQGDELSQEEIVNIVNLAMEIKENKLLYSQALYGNTIMLIFEKPSLRTRLSFLTGIQAAGGNIIECTFDKLHAQKELPKDMIRVVQGYCDVLIIRTHEEKIFYDMMPFSTIPIINSLSKDFHPCQILADLQTIYECKGTFEGITMSYIGNGNNILHSLLAMVPKVGVKIHFSCPEGLGPDKEILASYKNLYPSLIQEFPTPQEAVAQTDVVYTDVWNSMGMDTVSEDTFVNYQVNENLMSCMKSDAIFMHCLPMERGKEVSETLPDDPQSKVFVQSQNRMYAQLALLLLLKKKHSTE